MKASTKVVLGLAVAVMVFNVVDGHTPSGPKQEWVVDTTRYHKGHPTDRYPQHAVCVTTTEPYETKIVPITAEQAQGGLEKGAPCPS